MPTRFWGPALPHHRRLCEHHIDMDDDPWNKDTELDGDGFSSEAYTESKERF